ncbi:unnamed protein product, partial [Prorocentrum cordatum]
MLPPAAALPPGAGELPLRAYSAVASSSRLAVASANPAGALPLAVLAADCRLSSHGLPLCAGAPGHGGVQESLHGQGSLRREPDRPCSSRSQRGAAAVMQGWWSAACAYSGPQGRLLYGARSPRGPGAFFWPRCRALPAGTCSCASWSPGQKPRPPASRNRK